MNDNDSAGYLAAGYLIAAEQQRQANNAADEAQARSRALEQQTSELNDQLQRQAAHSNGVEDDYYALFNLLKQPMHLIAERNAFFARTYQQSQRELAERTASELAFMELAIQLGSKLGMSPQAVQRKARRMREDVLENRFPTEHGSNANASPLLRRQGPELLEQWKAQREAFVEKYTAIRKGGQIYDILEDDIADWDHFFANTMELARNGKREAQYNLGYCLCYGVGKPADQAAAEQWLLKAHGAGDRAAVMLLHYLYAWTESSKHNEEKAEHYLRLAEQAGHQTAASRRPKWEEQKRRDRWNREEPGLFRKLLVITPGQRPPELEQIKGRGYAWEDAATFLHACDYRFSKGKTENLGTLFSPKKNTECYLDIANPTDRSLPIWAELEYDKKKQPFRPLEWNGRDAIIGPKASTRVHIGKYHAGTEGHSLTIRYRNKEAFEPLVHLREIYSGIQYGTIGFTLLPAAPYTV